jgi:hypothetical protein
MSKAHGRLDDFAACNLLTTVLSKYARHSPTPNYIHAVINRSAEYKLLMPGAAHNRCGNARSPVLQYPLSIGSDVCV